MSSSDVTYGNRKEAQEAHLWVCSGQNIGRRFAIDGRNLVIGRAPDVEIPVLDDRVSQRHAELRCRRDGHFIADLGSTNGTFVNNQRVVETKLADGDLVQVGETVFEYLGSKDSPMTITVPNGGSTGADGVPPSLRTGARQVLDRARSSQPEDSGPGQTAADVAAAAPFGQRNLPQVQKPPAPVSSALVPASQAYRAPQFPAYQPPPMYPSMGDPRERRAYPMEEEDEAEGSLDLADIIMKVLAVIRFFRPYWKSILALGLICAIAGAATFIVRPPPRSAIFEVTLSPTLSANPFGPYQSNNVAFFKSAAVNFRSSGLIEKTMLEMTGDDPSPGIVSSIQSRLFFASVGPPTPNTYRGAYEHPDGSSAVSFLDTHVRLYLETEIEKTLRVIKAEADFLQQQLSETEKDLRQTEAELLEFKKQNIDGLPSQARQTYDLLFNLQQQEVTAEMNVSRVKASKRVTNTRLRTEQPLIKTRIRSDNVYQNAIADSNRQLAEARAAGKGPDHPEVVRLQKRLVELRTLAQQSAGDETMVETSRNPVYTQIQSEQRSLEVNEQVALQELYRVRKELKRVRGLVSRLPELEATRAELMRSYAAKKQHYQRIFDELNKTNLQLELERASAAARYDIITPPKLEYLPRSKKITQRAMMGGLGGVLLGLLLAIGRQFRRAPPPVLVKALALRKEQD